MNTFKNLLLKMAKLPAGDQQWIFRHLSPQQQEQFNQLNGHSLLGKARRFRKLQLAQAEKPAPENPSPEKSARIPAFCQELNQQHPLYIAIILELGHFAWQPAFLACSVQGLAIEHLLTNATVNLKPATKLAAVQQWQKHISFSDHLEQPNG